MSNITPAISLTTFKGILLSPENTSIHARLYKYMAKKYINITDIKFRYYDLKRYDTSNKTKIYLNGLVDFYKQIAPRQSELTFYGLPDSVDIFETLDNVGSQIKSMIFRGCEGGTLLQFLAQSNQSKHIEKLQIEGGRIDSIHLIKTMTTLTTLIISIDPHDPTPVHLADYLTVCPPSLKNLDIVCPPLIASPPFKTKLNSIERLKIECNTLSSNLGNTISFCFLNLITLDLVGGLMEDVNITLKSHHFQFATFFINKELENGFKNFQFSFKSPTQTDHYFCDKNETVSDIQDKKSIKHEDMEDLPTLSVVSLTESTLDMNSTIEVSRYWGI
jgi:hypothetical protein